jgi:hypothetical protein
MGVTPLKSNVRDVPSDDDREATEYIRDTKARVADKRARLEAAAAEGQTTRSARKKVARKK